MADLTVCLWLKEKYKFKKNTDNERYSPTNVRFSYIRTLWASQTLDRVVQTIFRNAFRDISSRSILAFDGPQIREYGFFFFFVYDILH